jgi:hypothetical protein
LNGLEWVYQFDFTIFTREPIPINSHFLGASIKFVVATPDIPNDGKPVVQGKEASKHPIEPHDDALREKEKLGSIGKGEDIVFGIAGNRGQEKPYPSNR